MFGTYFLCKRFSANLRMISMRSMRQNKLLWMRFSAGLIGDRNCIAREKISPTFLAMSAGVKKEP